jgi:hypothetical protein
LREPVQANRQDFLNCFRLTETVDVTRKKPATENFLTKWSDIIARTPSPKRPPKYRHKKRGGSYRLVGTAQVQAPDDAPLTDFEVVQVYVGEDGEMWVRRVSEFFDGRFEEIKNESS